MRTVRAALAAFTTVVAPSPKLYGALIRALLLVVSNETHMQHLNPDEWASLTSFACRMLSLVRGNSETISLGQMITELLRALALLLNAREAIHPPSIGMVLHELNQLPSVTTEQSYHPWVMICVRIIYEVAKNNQAKELGLTIASLGRVRSPELRVEIFRFYSGLHGTPNPRVGLFQSLLQNASDISLGFIIDPRDVEFVKERSGRITWRACSLARAGPFVAARAIANALEWESQDETREPPTKRARLEPGSNISPLLTLVLANLNHATLQALWFCQNFLMTTEDVTELLGIVTNRPDLDFWVLVVIALNRGLVELPRVQLLRIWQVAVDRLNVESSSSGACVCLAALIPILAAPHVADQSSLGLVIGLLRQMDRTPLLSAGSIVLYESLHELSLLDTTFWELRNSRLGAWLARAVGDVLVLPRMAPLPPLGTQLFTMFTHIQCMPTYSREDREIMAWLFPSHTKLSLEFRGVSGGSPIAIPEELAEALESQPQTTQALFLKLAVAGLIGSDPGTVAQIPGTDACNDDVLGLVWFAQTHRAFGWPVSVREAALGMTADWDTSIALDTYAIQTSRAALKPSPTPLEALYGGAIVIPGSNGIAGNRSNGVSATELVFAVPTILKSYALQRSPMCLERCMEMLATVPRDARSREFRELGAYFAKSIGSQSPYSRLRTAALGSIAPEDTITSLITSSSAESALDIISGLNGVNDVVTELCTALESHPVAYRLRAAVILITKGASSAKILLWILGSQANDVFKTRTVAEIAQSFRVDAPELLNGIAPRLLEMWSRHRKLGEFPFTAFGIVGSPSKYHLKLSGLQSPVPEWEQGPETQIPIEAVKAAGESGHTRITISAAALVQLARKQIPAHILSEKVSVDHAEFAAAQLVLDAAQFATPDEQLEAWDHAEMVVRTFGGADELLCAASSLVSQNNLLHSRVMGFLSSDTSVSANTAVITCSALGPESIDILQRYPDNETCRRLIELFSGRPQLSLDAIIVPDAPYEYFAYLFTQVEPPSPYKVRVDDVEILETCIEWMRRLGSSMGQQLDPQVMMGSASNESSSFSSPFFPSFDPSVERTGTLLRFSEGTDSQWLALIGCLASRLSTQFDGINKSNNPSTSGDSFETVIRRVQRYLPWRKQWVACEYFGAPEWPLPYGFGDAKGRAGQLLDTVLQSQGGRPFGSVLDAVPEYSAALPALLSNGTNPMGPLVVKLEEMMISGDSRDRDIALECVVQCWRNPQVPDLVLKPINVAHACLLAHKPFLGVLALELLWSRGEDVNWTLLAELYAQIGDPSLVAGVPKQASLTSVLDEMPPWTRLDYDLANYEVTGGSYSAKDCQNSEKIATNGGALLAHSLEPAGMYRLAYQAADRRLNDYTYAWRLQQWSLPPPSSPSTGSEVLFELFRAPPYNFSRAYERAGHQCIYKGNKTLYQMLHAIERPQIPSELLLSPDIRLGRELLAQNPEGYNHRYSTLSQYDSPFDASENSNNWQDSVSHAVSSLDSTSTLHDLPMEIRTQPYSSQVFPGDSFRTRSFNRGLCKKQTLEAISWEATSHERMETRPRIVEELIAACRSLRDHGQTQLAVAYSLRVEAVAVSPVEKLGAQVQTAATAWALDRQEQALSILQAAVNDPLFHAPSSLWSVSDVLRTLGEWSVEARHQPDDVIISRFFRPAEEAAQTAAEVAGLHHSLARLCDKRLHDTFRKSEITEAQALVAKGHSEVESLHSTDPHRAAKVRAQVQAWKKDLHAMEAAQISLLKQCIGSYLKALGAGDDHDDDTSRLIGVWFEHAVTDTASRAVQAACSHVPSRKFVPWLNQLTSRLGPEATALQAALETVLVRVGIDHPHHTLWPLLNQRFSGGVAAQGGNRLWGAIARGPRASTSLRKLMTSLEETARSMQQLAYYVVEQRKPSSKKPVRQILLQGSVERWWCHKLPELMVPVPTAAIPIRADGDYTHLPVVASVSREMRLAGGLSAPKIAVLTDSNGETHSMLLKSSHDDLRQDAVMEQAFVEANTLLPRGHRVRTYKVLPLGVDAGAIEYVAATKSLMDILDPLHTEFDARGWTGAKARSVLVAARDSGHRADVIKAYEHITQKVPPVLRHFFFREFRDPEQWLARKTTWSRSTAVASIVGYILGLGDRHCNNLLMDTNTGEVVHIDLGIAFDHGRRLRVPETVPFRLTRDVVDGMGVSGTNGVFTEAARATLSALRCQKNKIITVLEVFRYDALYKWKVSPDRAHQGSSATVLGTGLGLNEGESESAEAENALRGVRRKLDGALSVEATVRDLVKQATDPENLALLFAGWTPFY